MKTLVYYLVILCITVAGCSSQKRLPVVWKFKTGYAMVTHPAVTNGYAVFGSDKLYCVDAKNGNLIWTFDTVTAVTSQPVIKNNRVYFQCGGMYCLDLISGKLLWEFWSEEWGEKKPVVSATVALCIRGKTLYCLDGITGSKRYELPVGDGDSQLISAGDALIVAGNGILKCFDVISGIEKWQRSIPDEDMVYSLAADERRVYIPDHQGLRAFDLATGDSIWLFPIKDLSPIDSFVVADDAIYIVYGDVYCLDKEDGKLLWKYAPPAPIFTPILDGTMLYAMNIRMKLCRIDLQQRRQIDELRINRSGTFSGGFLYKGSGRATAYCMRLTM
ncbi:MAG: PQQ-binding-like beta-propeller repeat protein [Desulfobacterota bacterium]|nr:PQQ-binding-like beta-propeller repeat protein [Thermodesulfobacteriota bacterium]